jgi:hypothetical protein
MLFQSCPEVGRGRFGLLALHFSPRVWCSVCVCQPEVQGSTCSSATRRATVVVATRRGCVMATCASPASPAPRMNCGSSAPPTGAPYA